MLVNEAFLLTYDQANCHYFGPSLSDHWGINMQLPEPTHRKKSPFCFLNCWCKDAEFLSIVEYAWKIDVFGKPMFVLVSKLNHLKPYPSGIA